LSLLLSVFTGRQAALTFGRRLAGRTRARVVSFRGCSHWWQSPRAGEVTAELEAHWALSVVRG